MGEANVSNPSKGNITMYHVRYRPGTELARRFPQPEGSKVAVSFDTAEAAEAIRIRCANAADMEVYETKAVAKWEETADEEVE